MYKKRPLPANDNYNEHHQSKEMRDMCVEGWQVPDILHDHEWMTIDGRYFADMVEEEAA